MILMNNLDVVQHTYVHDRGGCACIRMFVFKPFKMVICRIIGSGTIGAQGAQGAQGHKGHRGHRGHKGLRGTCPQRFSLGGGVVRHSSDPISLGHFWGLMSLGEVRSRLPGDVSHGEHGSGYRGLGEEAVPPHYFYGFLKNSFAYLILGNNCAC